MNTNGLSKKTINNLNKIFKFYGPIKCAALYKDFKIYEGKTHAECLLQEPKGVLRNAEQGFVTDNGFFVNREFALLIAEHYNQIINKHKPENQLFSEDIISLDVNKI